MVTKENDSDKVFRPSALSFSVEIKDGQVVGTSGVMIDSKPDLYDDICTKSCLKDMVEQLNTRCLTMDLEHESFRGEDSSLNKAIIPISKIVHAEYVESQDGHGVVQIKDMLNSFNSRYQEVAGSIREGYLTAYSIAYRPTEVFYKSVGDKRYRILNKVDLLNVTYTGVPVNPRAIIGGVQMKANSEDFFLKLADGEGVGVKASDSEAFLIEAKSRGGFLKTEKKQIEEGSAPAADSVEGILKEVLARLAALEAKVSEADTSVKDETQEEEPVEEKTDEESESKPEEEELKALKKMMTQLKAKVNEQEKILSSPFVKGIRSSMDSELKAQETKISRKSLISMA